MWILLLLFTHSCSQLFATPWTAARQASLSFTISQSLLKLMSIESVIQYFSSGLGGSLGWFVQNEIYLPSSSHPIQPWKTSTLRWLIGAETLPGQGQKECDPPTFCRSLTDGLNGPHTLYSFGCFPSLSSSDSWKVWYSFAGFDMLLPEAGKAPLLLIWPSKLALRKSSV